MTNRTVLEVTGPDRISFLQGLVTNDVEKAESGSVYAALLTPQGKYIADFFLIGRDDRVLIDVAASHAPLLLQKLSMYRLRAAVEIAPSQLVVSRGLTNQPNDALVDPRTPAMGWRHYAQDDYSEEVDWDRIRVEHAVPASGNELTPDSYILEMGFERLNGVDFKKGCFVGQEIVARMKHKTELRKGLVQVELDGEALAGTKIITDDGRDAGMLHTVSDRKALAYLRFDRAKDGLTADGTSIWLPQN